jgi:hypothetical protein
MVSEKFMAPRQLRFVQDVAGLYFARLFRLGPGNRGQGSCENITDVGREGGELRQTL